MARLCFVACIDESVDKSGIEEDLGGRSSQCWFPLAAACVAIMLLGHIGDAKVVRSFE